VEAFAGAIGSGGTVYLVTTSPSSEVRLAVQKWQAREMRVVVALIDGSGFPASPRRQRAAKVALTSEAYDTQYRSLLATGAHVVGLRPQPPHTQQEFTAPIRTALHQLLLATGNRYSEAADMAKQEKRTAI
jgi:hypothetical protein